VPAFHSRHLFFLAFSLRYSLISSAKYPTSDTIRACNPRWRIISKKIKGVAVIRWLTAGESHGPALSAILEGMPAHIEITKEMIDADLQRRRLGFGRGARQTFEADVVSILGGVRHGISQGGPISLQIGNSEWPKWSKVMAPEIVDPKE